MPNWRTIVTSRDPRHMVRGTELECYIPEGFAHRFAVYSVRTVERDPAYTIGQAYIYDRRYVVRDASTVRDDEIMSGKRPDIVASFATETELDAWLAQRELAECKITA